MTIGLPGPAVELPVSAAAKTMRLECSHEIAVLVEGSCDGARSFVPAWQSEGQDGPFCLGIFQFMRVRRLRGASPATLQAVSQEDRTCTWLELTVPPPPTNESPFQSLEGRGDQRTFAITGRYSGVILVEGMNEASGPVIPILQFDSGGPESITLRCPYEFMRVRRIRGTGNPRLAVGCSIGHSVLHGDDYLRQILERTRILIENARQLTGENHPAEVPLAEAAALLGAADED